MIELNRIYNEDCLETMRRMEDKSVDLIVTSPPYNTGGKSLGYHPKSTTGDNFYSMGNDDRKDSEYVEWCRAVITDTLRVSTYVCWNIQWIETTRSAIVDVFKSFDTRLKDIFVWQKQAVAQIARGSTASGHEFVFIFGEDNNRNFKTHNFPPNGYVPNTKTWYKKESFPEHHATFPIELPEYFIAYWTKLGGVVYDPFIGMGTTAVACEKLGRRWIGSEINPDYCKIARKRIAVQRAQLKFAYGVENV